MPIIGLQSSLAGLSRAFTVVTPPVVIDDNGGDLAGPLGGTPGPIGIVLQGADNALIFWSDNDTGVGGYDTSFGWFVDPLSNLTGIPFDDFRMYAQRSDLAPGGTLSNNTLYSIPHGSPKWLKTDSAGAVLATPSTWSDGELLDGFEAFFAPEQSAVGPTRPWLILRMFGENDSLSDDAAETSVYAAANTQFMARFRSAFGGRATSLLPTFYVQPAQFNAQPAANAAVRNAWNAQTASPAANSYWGVGSTNDAEVNSSGFYWTSNSANRLAVRMAVRIAKWLYVNGYAFTDLSWLPTLGPRIVAAHRVNGSSDQIDLVIQHDKGTDILMPVSPVWEQFLVMDNGVQRTLTALVRQSPTRLRATLNAALAGTNAQITFDYGLYASFDGAITQITDNWHLLSKPALAATVPHLDTLRMPLARMRAPITVTVESAFVPSAGASANSNTVANTNIAANKG